jgi:hypothetical protein
LGERRCNLGLQFDTLLPTVDGRHRHTTAGRTAWMWFKKIVRLTYLTSDLDHENEGRIVMQQGDRTKTDCRIQNCTRKAIITYLGHI